MSLKVVSTEAYLSPDHEFCLHGDLVWVKLALAWISLTTVLACFCIPLSLVLDVISTGASLNWTTSTREAMDGDLDGKSKGERQQRAGRIYNKGCGRPARSVRRPLANFPRRAALVRSASAAWQRLRYLGPRVVRRGDAAAAGHLASAASRTRPTRFGHLATARLRRRPALRVDAVAGHLASRSPWTGS